FLNFIPELIYFPAWQELIIRPFLPTFSVYPCCPGTSGTLPIVGRGECRWPAGREVLAPR
ncbi:MAG: hypothetical protein J6I61_10165, partial [Prevotella sp.]|nr:hypothetical protein [Prevotella sp.]